MSSPSPDWQDSEMHDGELHGSDGHGRGRDRRGGERRRRGTGRFGADWGGRDWSGRDWGDRSWGGQGWGAEQWSEPPWSVPDRRDAERRTPERRQGPVRIGDAERDQAVSLLSDHFVAGRLTQTEFEERSEQATRARYADDLVPLFDDLPSHAELQPAQGPWSPPAARSQRRRPGPPPPFLMLMPFLMVGLVITAVTLAGPWLLWGLFWFMLISGMTRRRWHHH